MKPAATGTDIRGVWATIINRLDEQGHLDLTTIDDQVSAYARAGVAGIYSGGTASEIHCQTEAEFEEISTRFAEAARAVDLPFQIGAAHPLPQGSLRRIAFSARLEPLAIQITLPDWTSLDFDSVRLFLNRAVTAAAGCPLVLYNPPHAKTVLTPAQMNEITKSYPSLIGLKCGGGDAAWYADMAPALKRISVFIPGHFYASGVRQGAHGSYSNMACLSPKAAVDWAQMSDAAAAEMEDRIATFNAEAIAPIIARGHPGFVCDKAMATAGGWAKMNPRMMWPYTGATDEDILLIRSAAKRHIPEFTSDMP